MLPSASRPVACRAIHSLAAAIRAAPARGSTWLEADADGLVVAGTTGPIAAARAARLASPQAGGGPRRPAPRSGRGTPVAVAAPPDTAARRTARRAGHDRRARSRSPCPGGGRCPLARPGAAARPPLWAQQISVLPILHLLTRATDSDLSDSCLFPAQPFSVSPIPRLPRATDFGASDSGAPSAQRIPASPIPGLARAQQISLRPISCLAEGAGPGHFLTRSFASPASLGNDTISPTLAGKVTWDNTCSTDWHNTDQRRGGLRIRPASTRGRVSPRRDDESRRDSST